MTSLSFEFYPPKTSSGFEKLQTIAKTLAQVKPHYFSVTYGANGSTRTDTPKTVELVYAATHINAVPHIAGLGSTKQDIDTLLHAYRSNGIKRLVVLRGDLPAGVAVKGDFSYAYELVHYIRQTTGNYFHITVAGYPETHPQAPTPQKDIEHLKRKMDAGANDIITQYFFNPDSYFYFKDRCAVAGIDCKITVGIMPITNVERLVRFSTLCGADIPLWIRKYLSSFENDPQALVEFGNRFLIAFCKTLQQGGAPGFHFYTLNQAEPSMTICKELL